MQHAACWQAFAAGIAVRCHACMGQDLQHKPACWTSVAVVLHATIWLQDTPDGSYAMLERKGKKQKANLTKELFNGFTNYRIWLLAACYAYSFGVEVCLCLAVSSVHVLKLCLHASLICQ